MPLPFIIAGLSAIGSAIGGAAAAAGAAAAGAAAAAGTAAAAVGTAAAGAAATVGGAVAGTAAAVGTAVTGAAATVGTAVTGAAGAIGTVATDVIGTKVAETVTVKGMTQLAAKQAAKKVVGCALNRTNADDIDKCVAKSCTGKAVDTAFKHLL